MKTRWELLGVVGLAALVIAGCSASGEGTSGQAAGRPPVAVEAAAVRVGELAETIEVVGSLQPKFSAAVQSEFTAIVRDVFVTEWVPVRRGQPLARLDSREAESTLEAARAALLQAEVADTRAAREHERTLKLKASGLATQQNVDDAETAREAAAAATSAARAQLSAAETYAEKQLIRAPLDGVVSFRGVNVGDRVESMGSGGPMFRIVDNRLLELTAIVPSVRMEAVRPGNTLTFTSDAFAGRVFKGVVKHVNPAVDEASRSVKVVAEVPNPTGELRGGMFVKGQIVTGTRTGVMLAPRDALLAWDLAAGSAEVLVVSGEAASRRPVRTGAVAGDTVEVVEGLAVGELVVTRGAFNVAEGDRITLVSSESAAGQGVS